jgi:acyl carrier protein
MNASEFLNNFANQFDETELSVFNLKTNFKELNEWSSLTALSVMAMIDDEYGIMLSGNEINIANTIEDLFKLVEQKNK